MLYYAASLGTRRSSTTREWAESLPSGVVFFTNPGPLGSPPRIRPITIPATKTASTAATRKRLPTRNCQPQKRSPITSSGMRKRTNEFYKPILERERIILCYHNSLMNWCVSAYHTCTMHSTLFDFNSKNTSYNFATIAFVGI